ncbi:MAG: hypothetical protein AAGN46_18855 [Acidobacteriota bacterium]
MGGQGREDDLSLADEVGASTIQLDGGAGNLVMGGNSHTGDLRLLDAEGNVTVHVGRGANPKVIVNGVDISAKLAEPGG